ncbi:glycosyltransferase [Lacticaseibacillus manihotivorans]|uniref:glycosyltransferase n=1 Tax=Lacticaseibacillus manihotivorans TaxID=88233 RepID=UPI0006D1C02F|nr:glycosyltransferase [Lacticaseibacillus manihotivorans]
MQIALLMPCYRPQHLSQIMAAVQAQIDICTKLWPQVNFRLWLIDDGASPAVADEMAQLKASVPHAHKLGLSRHFGYDAAVQAGLASIAADAYVVIDPEQATMIDTFATMIDALIVGGYQVVALPASIAICFVIVRSRFKSSAPYCKVPADMLLH